MLVRIPYDRTAHRVTTLVAQKMETLPEFLRNSVTWDQGKEMAEHASFIVKTGHQPKVSRFRTPRLRRLRR